MKKTLFILLAIISVNGFSQDSGELVVDKKTKRMNTPGGELQFGMRSTASMFSNDGSPGYGFGGQFRIKFGKQLNSEWFADYITSNVEDIGTRNVGHIGWSVMFYLKKMDDTYYRNNRFIPYLIAGHCFDYTRITPLNTVTEIHSDEYLDRWSSATQAGLGLIWNYSQQFNLSLTSQYMLHLGRDIEYEVVNDQLFLMENSGNSTLEGHLLVTLSMNVRIADLW